MKNFRVFIICGLIGCGVSPSTNNIETRYHCNTPKDGAYNVNMEITSSTCGGVGEKISGIENINDGKPVPEDCNLVSDELSLDGCIIGTEFLCKVNDEDVRYKGTIRCVDANCNSLSGEITMILSDCEAVVKINYSYKE